MKSQRGMVSIAVLLILTLLTATVITTAVALHQLRTQLRIIEHEQQQKFAR